MNATTFRRLANAVDGLEARLGMKARKVIMVLIDEGVSERNALELHYQERPEDRDPDDIIFRKIVSPAAVGMRVQG